MFFRNENYARGGETVLDIAVCSTVGENLKYVKEGNRRNEMKEGEGDSMMRWKRRDHCCQYASPKKKKKNRRFYTICTTKKRRPIECRLHIDRKLRKKEKKNGFKEYCEAHTHEHTRTKTTTTTTTTRRDLFFQYTKKKKKKDATASLHSCHFFSFSALQVQKSRTSKTANAVSVLLHFF